MMSEPYEIHVQWTARTVRAARALPVVGRAWLLVPAANDARAAAVHVPFAPGLPGMAEWVKRQRGERW